MSKALVTFSLLLSSFGYASHADETLAEARSCLDEINNIERLACYDSILGYEEPVPDDSQEDDYSREWVFEDVADGLTDADRSRVYLDGIAPDNGAINMRLYLGCDGEGGFDVYVSNADYLGVSSRNGLQVEYRFDSNDPIKERWTLGADGMGGWLPDGYRDFRRELDNGSTLLIQLTDFRGFNYRSVFEGLGSNPEAVKYVKDG